MLEAASHLHTTSPPNRRPPTATSVTGPQIGPAMSTNRPVTLAARLQARGTCAGQAELRTNGLADELGLP